MLLYPQPPIAMISKCVIYTALEYRPNPNRVTAHVSSRAIEVGLKNLGCFLGF